MTFFQLTTGRRSFGFSVPITQLLTVPPYVFASEFRLFCFPALFPTTLDYHTALTLLLFAHYSDKIKMRSPFILIGLTMLLIGFSINISDVPRGAKYFGTFFCVAGSYASFPGVVAWYGFSLT